LIVLIEVMGGFYSRKYSNAPFTLHGPRLYRHTRSGPRADVCVCTHTKVLCCSGPLLQVVLALMCVYKCPLSCHEVRHIDGPHLCMKSRTLTGPRKTVLTFVLNPTVPTCIAIHVCVCVCVCNNFAALRRDPCCSSTLVSYLIC